MHTLAHISARTRTRTLARMAFLIRLTVPAGTAQDARAAEACAEYSRRIAVRSTLLHRTVRWQVCAKDPLYRPTKEEKALFWNYRNFLKSDAYVCVCCG